MEIWFVLVGVMLLAAVVAAAGGFRSRPRRGVVVDRPVRRAAARPVVEDVVERRVR